MYTQTEVMFLYNLLSSLQITCLTQKSFQMFVASVLHAAGNTIIIIIIIIDFVDATH